MSPIATVPTVFQPLKVGAITLSHRIALAPLTRMKANAAHVHQPVASEYYSQRGATPGTLLITEATFISAKAGGYGNVPGVYTDDQVKAWKEVVDAVHAKGSYLYLQLWALGRTADEGTLKKESDGKLDVVSASDIPLEGHATPRPLTEEEIQQYVKDYALAAKRFVEEAGGDGVEIHGANGYLLNQFIDTNSNKRTDKYGGSVENRLRFPFEVIKAVTEAVGENKTGIRLSPWNTFQAMRMPDNKDVRETYATFVTQLKQDYPDFAYIHVVEPRVVGVSDVPEPEGEDIDFLHKIWTPKPFLAAGGFNGTNVYGDLEKRANTVAVFGRWFISNPDLVERIRKNVELEPYNRKTFYVPGPENTEGYTSYENKYKYESQTVQVKA